MMKKSVPWLIKIEIESDILVFQENFYSNWCRSLDKGYDVIPEHDFILLAAIHIKKVPFNEISYSFKREVISRNLREKIKYTSISLLIKEGFEVSEEEFSFYYKTAKEIFYKRKQIAKKEIIRTGIAPKNITKTEYYKALLWFMAYFDDITLMHWFVPIILRFDKAMHIYVKHVEETKFNDGQFKKRTFFTYKSKEIFSLLHSILSQEKEDIQNHFLDVAWFIKTKQYDKMQDYHRGFGKFKPIIFNEDRFSLTINKLGHIVKFHQL